MDFWGEALWFQTFGFSSRFWLEIVYSIVLGAVGAVIAFGVMYLLTIPFPKSVKYARWIAILIAVFAGAVWGYSNWDVILKYFDKVSGTFN